MSPLHHSVLLREAQASPLARSVHSTQVAKVSRHQVSRHKVAKESWFSLSAYSAPSAVKASAVQGEETGGVACATHSKQRGAKKQRRGTRRRGNAKRIWIPASPRPCLSYLRVPISSHLVSPRLRVSPLHLALSPCPRVPPAVSLPNACAFS